LKVQGDASKVQGDASEIKVLSSEARDYVLVAEWFAMEV
jgi:hypothetical protein